MTCVTAQFPTPSSTEFWSFLICAAFILAGVGVWYGILANRRKANESNEPARRIIPSPLITREEDPFVTRSQFDKHVSTTTRQFSELEERVEKKINEHQNYVKGKFHKINSDLQGIQSSGDHRGEVIFGKLDKVIATLGGCCTDIAATKERTAATAANMQHLQNKVEDINRREIEGRRARR